MLKFFLFSLTILIVHGGIAYAEDSGSKKPLSPESAVNRSLLSTTIPVISGTLMILADPENGVGAIGALWGTLGLLIGPGVGHLYAHHSWGLWRGLLIRLGGLAAMLGSVAATWDDPGASEGWALFLGGCAIEVGSCIFDIWQAGQVARNYNRKHNLDYIGLAPFYSRENRAWGMRLSFGF